MKKSKNTGFTLAELLIVVAIIGVLVAISIPIFTSQLKKSRLTVDMANVRSAKAAAAAAYMCDGKSLTYSVL
ncbi:MAG: prepilin-type N-terminal cleavage/methylation domain-containing protein [Lactimicrobium massiliense]|nr:prepilin-type N-terminal cleavage/methylation domain-containing protein [Lactimicrobium massiliense]MDD6457245.1 prepilin-type N-terminal cleavage/methylation domain-containing protein [Lactimicrobium massiliense]